QAGRGARDLFDTRPSLRRCRAARRGIVSAGPGERRMAVRGGMNNLQTRALSAIVLAAIVLWVTWLGGIPFRLLVALGAALVYYEWISMAGLRIRSWAVGGVALAVVAVALVSGFSAGVLAVVLLAGVAVTLVAGWVLFRDTTPCTTPAIALAYATL